MQSHVLGNDVADLDLAAAGGHSRHIGAGLDLIGDNRIGTSMKFLDTPNLNNIRAGALDIRAHRVEEVGHIHDVGLLGHILHHSQAHRQGWQPA